MNWPRDRFETLEESKVSPKFPISFASREKITKRMRAAFKFQNIYDPKTQTDKTVRWPFERYIYSWDNWDGFISDVFSKIRTFFQKRIQYDRDHLNDCEDEEIPEDALPIEELDKWEELVNSYLRTTEEIIQEWIILLGTGKHKECLFEEYAQKNLEAELMMVHPIFEEIGIEEWFHHIFVQFAMEIFLEETAKSEEENRNKMRKLASQVARLEKENEKTTGALRESIKKRSSDTITVGATIVNTERQGELEREKAHLQDILKRLWYTESAWCDPEKWLIERDRLVLEGKSFEWESIAITESERSESLKKQLQDRENYIAFLEHRLEDTGKSLEKQYSDERWKQGIMKGNELMIYLSWMPAIAENFTTPIVEFIECINARVSGNTLSSTGNAHVWTGSGHMANIVIMPLLNFVKKRLKSGEYGCLGYSWKAIINNYIKETGWSVNEGNYSVFASLFNSISEEPGNIGNMKTLLDALRAIESTYNAELKWVCDIVHNLSQERMNVLKRQIFGTKNTKAGQ